MFIETRQLTKEFEISRLDIAIALFRLLSGRRLSAIGARRKRAVDNVSVSVHEGERVGIIGHNGAGKTTIIQMIAGLMEPSEGSVEVKGHITCVMTLGVGLREHLSGRENIYLDGEINGKTRAYTRSIIDDIIAFADIGEFINHPVRTYSSGMKSRLSFAMLTHIDPEILIIDEALSTGDVSFVTKASSKIKEICNKGKIVIIVSHSMGAIIEMCNRCIWMDQGRIIMDGDPKKVTEAYMEETRRREAEVLVKEFSKKLFSSSVDGFFWITDLHLIDMDGKERTIFDVGEQMTVEFSVRCAQPLEQYDFRLSVERLDGILVTRNVASEDGFIPDSISGISRFRIPMGPIRYGKGTYAVKVEVLGAKKDGLCILAERNAMLKVENVKYTFENPVFLFPTAWSIQEMERQS